MPTARTRGRRQRRSGWQIGALALFAVLLILVGGLVFFTGNRSPLPKVGIDLQGGTRVTLVPQGGKPTADQLSQARTIMENRVNGMGVSGAEVVTDGDTLVITVPGDDSSQARAVGKTSQLLFRPVEQAPPPTQAFPDVLNDVANKWVAAGAMEKDKAVAKLAEIGPQLEKAGLAGAAGKLKITANPPAPAATGVEEQQRRNEIVTALKNARQSTDANTQQAAATLLNCEKADPLAGADDPALPLVTCDGKSPIILGPAPVLVGQTDGPGAKRLTGELIDTNSPITGGFDPNEAQMAITFRFKTGDQTPGGETWYKFGQDMLQRQVAITLDSRVISAPRVQSPTPAGEMTRISGQFSDQEAKDLANNLRYGALPLSFVGQNGEPGGTTTTISPTLGTASLKAGLLAGLVGLVLVALYALWYYRRLGLVAIVSLLASFTLVYGLLVLLGRWIGYSLDLAGIAGLIIGIGTTADSFVVYFERIKDEIHQGSSFRSAVPRAWRRARKTVVTGNFVSLIAAVILYFLAVGDVKGFAFTLGLTTLSDVLIAFTVTAPLLILLSRRPSWANPRWNGLASAFRAAERSEHARAVGSSQDADRVVAAGTAGTKPGTGPDTERDTADAAAERAEAKASQESSRTSGRKVGFLERLSNGDAGLPIVPNRRRWYAALGIVLLLCLATIALRGFTLGIDFAGGTRMSMPPTGNPSDAAVSRVFEDATGVTPQSVQTVGAGETRVVEITSQRLSEDQITKARSALFNEFKPVDNQGKVSEKAVSDSTVSESWGDSITKRMLLALGAFLALVFLYITLRMERDMALAAIACVIVDLTVVAGVYSLVGFEVSPATVIGLLTILAYSLYDTVVVFDKVHENTAGLLSSTRATYAEQVNLSVNQTIMRSINTSVFSMVPIASLLIVAVGLMGVGTLKDLALVQFIGVIAGTFSSILFASPLLVSIKSRERRYREHDEKVRRARSLAAGRATSQMDDGADAPETGSQDRTEPASTGGAATGGAGARRAVRSPLLDAADAPSRDAGVDQREEHHVRGRRSEEPFADGRSWRPGM